MPRANMRRVIEMTGDISAGDMLTISDLLFNVFYGGVTRLELDYDSDGLMDAVDDKTITVQTYYHHGVTHDGYGSDGTSVDMDLNIHGTVLILE